MQRREFIGLVGGAMVAAAAWPLVVRAQQSLLPIVGFVRNGSAERYARHVAAFRRGLNETGCIEGQNVTVEYHWLDYDRQPALVADLIQRQVAVIAILGSMPATLAAKTATATIPIVFAIPQDPVRLGLVANLARPGGNVTGINYFTQEVLAKRLGLLHDLLPKATRVAVLINPTNPLVAETTLHQVREAAPAMGLQIQILTASTSDEVDAVFATFAHERPDAVFVAPDSFFTNQSEQLAALTAREKIPASYSVRENVTAGGLMSYGTDLANVFHQVGVYTGRILKGAKPADLPVVQSTKFELAVNVKTARALGIEIPSGLLSIADEVID